VENHKPEKFIDRRQKHLNFEKQQPNKHKEKIPEHRRVFGGSGRKEGKRPRKQKIRVHNTHTFGGGGTKRFGKKELNTANSTPERKWKTRERGGKKG